MSYDLRMMKNLTTYSICLIISLLSFSVGLNAQELEDSLISGKKPLFTRLIQHDYNQYAFQALHWLGEDIKRNPKVALIAGIVPGGGQLYNRQFEKLLAYYAGVGGILYLIDNNYTQYRSLQNALELRVAGKADEYINVINTLDRLVVIRDQFRKNLELSYFAALAYYMVGIVDGFVSAHLSSFDISDDISLRPTLIPTLTASPVLALSFTWNF